MKHDSLNVLLDRLQVELALDEDQRNQLRAGSQAPWWLSALLGLAAWFSASFFIVAFLGPWLLLIEGPVGRGLAGLLLLLAALWLFRRGQSFAHQIALALSLTGQGLLIFVLAEHLQLELDNLRAPAVLSMLLAGILLWLPSSFLHRHVCALVVLASAAVLVGSGTGLALYCLLLAACACALWLGRVRWATHPQAGRIRAIADAATLLSLCLAATMHHQLLEPLLDLQKLAAARWTSAVYQVGMGLLLLTVVAWLLRNMKRAAYWSGLGATVVLVILAHPAPGLVLTLALGLAVFQASNRSWMALLPAFAAFYLFILYYSLHISLLQKSLVMVASGLVLLVGGLLLPRLLRVQP
ncbi:MAG: DUF4401 domain-containing protein [Pseudomonas sp.]|nr:DUF4401 domain-containing protein [Pseudomonas sp.]